MVTHRVDYVTIKIPDVYAKQIDVYIDCGVYSSRAEMVRVALQELLSRLKTEADVSTQVLVKEAGS